MFQLNDFTRKLSWKNSGVLLVVPLDLAITPMRVLQDPLIGPECRSMFEEGEVDDRFLMILFLMLERLRNNSSWKPYASITLAYFWVRFFFFRVVWVYSVYIVLGTLTCFPKPLEIHSGLLMMSFWSWRGQHYIGQLNYRSHMFLHVLCYTDWIAGLCMTLYIMVSVQEDRFCQAVTTFNFTYNIKAFTATSMLLISSTYFKMMIIMIPKACWCFQLCGDYWFIWTLDLTFTVNLNYKTSFLILGGLILDFCIIHGIDISCIFWFEWLCLDLDSIELDERHVYMLQRKRLLSLYEDKVKGLVQKLLILDGDLER
jgi:hypothetical protein